MDDSDTDSACGGGHTYRDTLQTSRLPTDPHATTAQLRASLEEVQTLLSELHRKQQELEQRLALVVYPVLTLPNEIVSRIFVACLPSHGRVCPSRETAPLLLAQICRHWRDIAIETCELWSSMDLDTRHVANQCLLTWISRGKQSLLSWTLREGSPTACALIPAIAGRLWRLELCLESASYRELADNHISFPNLRQLALLGKQSALGKHSILTFSDAPLLRELKICNPPRSLKLDFYPLLTTLDIKDITSATLLSILRRFPQLLHVAAYVNNTSSGLATIAPSLQSFVLHEYSQCSNILEFLTLPALRRLEIEEAEINLRSCLNFFKRSACTLDHLGMRLDDHADDLIACLDAMPTVASLCIDAIRMSSIAAILTKTPLLVPRLAALTLRLHDDDEYHQSLTDFLCMRFARGLVSVKVDLIYVSSWPPPTSCLLKLNELISSGMDVELHCDGEYWVVGGYQTREIEEDPYRNFPWW